MVSLGSYPAQIRSATNTHFSAVRDGGARRDDESIAVSDVVSLDAALINSDVAAPSASGKVHTRNLGASAHSICLVAEGTLDGYVDVESWQHPWDYLGASLVISEAGGVLTSPDGSLAHRRGDESPRRLLVASTPTLLDELVEVFAPGAG
jgi:myo-inositol-1(or 4)-monophosphatase